LVEEEDEVDEVLTEVEEVLTDEVEVGLAVEEVEEE
jgi:hypothetical protein